MLQWLWLAVVVLVLTWAHAGLADSMRVRVCLWSLSWLKMNGQRAIDDM